MKQDISVIILTYNEEQHIARCLQSLKSCVKEIFIVDSFSTDNTVKIAQSLGAKVYTNKWVNYAVQFQWGLDNCDIQSKWVMRMDADEYLLPELNEEISENISKLEENISQIYIKRRVFFMNQWIKHGSYYPIWLLRIWKFEYGKIEERWMDEHIKVSQGSSIKFEHDLVDHNLSNLTAWTSKHNNYATREAIDLLNYIYEFVKYDEVQPKLFGTQAERKRWLKVRYSKLPLFLRPILYFHYRYFIKLGFLDKKAGFIWHFLQGFWYRFLVDSKINEIYFHAGKEKKNILDYLEKEYKIIFKK
ncbi:MAG: Glycosyl transferase, family 2 [uncultured Sulfurovum sp.]|uniref:Glycosyl transferase, family 2 n=1 Tax=uncultured Sulfurovum sp. TaxID=269237 RepID=A0A6S6SGL8_9BACT|nr:MAG: Glycosyl transferase, family 2 [uncultured Sulfurovum sp.]